jgi:hypothetical protein
MSTYDVNNDAVGGVTDVKKQTNDVSGQNT